MSPNHVELLLSRLQRVTHSKSGWTACCPAHDDQNPSLSISVGDDGRVLVHCFAGCGARSVVESLGMRLVDLMPSSPHRPSHQGQRERQENGQNNGSVQNLIASPAQHGDATDSLADNVLAVARKYVARGWPVFPVNSDKTPRTRHGFHDASTDAAQVDVWWTRWPEAGIGIPTGSETFLVLDIDPRNGGDHTFDQLVAEHGPLPDTMQSFTGGGGRHYFFRCPPGTRCMTNYLPGIDIKAEGGYVVVPPSPHFSGGTYAWEPSSGPGDVELATFPLPGSLKNDTSNLAEFGVVPVLGDGPAQPGERNSNLAQLAGRWIHDGHDLADVIDRAVVWNDQNPVPLQRREVCRTCESVWRTDKRNHQGQDSEAEEWPEPLPIIGDGGPGPVFPLNDAFPVALADVRDYVAAVAEAYQVPVDLPAMLVLPVAATAGAQKFELQVVPGWREISSLWTLILLPSGARKSPVFAEVVFPVHQWERDEAKRRGPEIRRALEKRAIRERRLDHLRRKAAGDSAAADKACQQLLALANESESTPIIMPRLITTETTTEALAKTMSQSAERALVASAEADALDVLLGRYGGAPNLGVWLAGYSGEPVRIDRRGRESDCLERPVLNVALTCQPDGARELFGNRQARGRGLLARFLTIAPRSLVGERQIDPPPIPGTLREDFHDRIRHLLDLPLHPEPQSGPTVVLLDPEAQEVFRKFRARLEPRLGPSGDLDDHCTWGSKLAGNLVRIALVLHLLEHSSSVSCVSSVKPVSGATMLAALTWEPYLVAHEKRIQGIVGANPDQALAEKILRWIKKLGQKEFSRRDAFRSCGQTVEINTVDKIDPGLELLENLGWIRAAAAQSNRAGRSRSPCYRVHPRLTTADRTDSTDKTPVAGQSS